MPNNLSITTRIPQLDANKFINHEYLLSWSVKENNSPSQQNHCRMPPLQCNMLRTAQSKHLQCGRTVIPIKVVYFREKYFFKLNPTCNFHLKQTASYRIMDMVLPLICHTRSLAGCVPADRPSHVYKGSLIFSDHSKMSVYTLSPPNSSPLAPAATLITSSINAKLPIISTWAPLWVPRPSSI